MTQQTKTLQQPEILAPAGDTQCFLAALAAGANAIYVGLKNFSARMEADNFGLKELSRLTDLAHAENAKVYITMNTILKEDELIQAYHLLERLEKQVHADGIIVQDLAYLSMARQVGWSGSIALSTLANVTHKEMLNDIRKMGVTRIILPRELSIDEIRSMGEACPDGLTMELFIHGALCYCVSGRCYWSSYMGGKSGLRGRCVQPCRRLYHPVQNENDQTHKRKTKQKEKGVRYFSCLDLSLDVLAKTLLSVPNLTSWKIEGRKKGPHYVYHTVSAYKMLRDAPGDPTIKRMAEGILAMALGRPTSHARFLPQKERIPTDPSGLTSSGLLIGSIRNADRPEIKVREKLLPNDYLRIGTEDERWHTTLRIEHPLQKGASYVLNIPKQKTPPTGTPVFLIDRREKELVLALRAFQAKLDAYPGRDTRVTTSKPRLPKACSPKRRPDMRVLDSIPHGRDNRAGSRSMLALWLSAKTCAISHTVARRVYWWLPPVVWPDESHKFERLVTTLWRDGCRHFVLNAPWQRAFFPKELTEGSDLVCGPFCNLSNALALACVASLGIRAAFVSPELSKDDILALPKQSPIPLGFVLDGYWPCGISRFGLLGIKQNTPFASPKGEIFWARNYGQNTWIYPAWPLDLREKQNELLNAGYTFFASLREKAPITLQNTKRPGLFNWDQNLL
ncbi:MAG: U32 family peptidase [Desulfovibrio sp.]|nr:U32 family peptidase [Desulfovibrio sp.]